MWTVIAVVVGLACLVATDRLAKRKGRPEMWPFAVLGPIGLLVVALTPPKR